MHSLIVGVCSMHITRRANFTYRKPSRDHISENGVRIFASTTFVRLTRSQSQTDN